MTTSDQHRIDQETIETLAAAVSKAIESNHGNKRFIDLERLPLICLAQANQAKSIEEMKIGFFRALDEIKDMIASNRKESDTQHESFITKGEFTPYKKALNIVGTALILAAVGAFASLILIK